MKLLPRDSLVVTGPYDHADWNYRPVLGFIQRWRFRMIRSLLPAAAGERLLEVGYGSGIFLPELARHAAKLYGIDVHCNGPAVASILSRHGTSARLTSGRAEALPFADGSFDCVVVVSSLEFVEPMTSAAQELLRVLRPGGRLVVVTPGHSPLVDFGLKLLTGKSAEEDFQGRRGAVVPGLLSCFGVEARRTAPPIGSWLICLYRALRLVPLKGRQGAARPQ